MPASRPAPDYAAPTRFRELSPALRLPQPVNIKPEGGVVLRVPQPGANPRDDILSPSKASRSSLLAALPPPSPVRS